MSGVDTTDVIVIGGGPAGSTIATQLVRQGFTVKLFEKEKFPRPHVGESLLPFCYDIFKELGVLEELEKRFVRKPGACFVNHDGKSEKNYCFNKVVDEQRSLSFHVRRDEFDQLLLNHSKANGTEVFEEHRVVQTSFTDDLCSVEVISNHSISSVHKTRFIVDATGRDCLLAKANQKLEPIEDMDRVAVSVHWKCNEIPIELRNGSVRITYLGGKNKKGWIWCIPIDTNRVSIGVVVDAKYYKSKIKQLRSSSDNWLEDYYLQELKTSASLNNIIEDMTIDDSINVNGNYSYKSTEKFGSRYALVGDAAQFIDPIFASGVYIAMKSASIVSDGIASFLNNGEQLKLQEAYKIIDDGYAVVHELIKLYYDPNSINFAEDNHELEKDGLSFSDHNHSFALIHLLLAGDFFEKGDVYLPFLDSLKKRKKLSKWKNLIGWNNHVTHKNKEEENCGNTYDQIFKMS